MKYVPKVLTILPSLYLEFWFYLKFRKKSCRSILYLGNREKLILGKEHNKKHTSVKWISSTIR